MPQTITQTSTTLSNQLQVPLNNVDFVDDLTVKGPFQALLNNDYRLARAAFSTVPNISMSSFNGTTIKVDAFSDLLLAEFNTTITTSNLLYGQNSGVFIGTANLETGVNYVADTVYYVYATYGVVNCTFQISTVVPDSNMQFKTGDITKRFLGMFITTATATIFNFSCVGRRYLCNIASLLTLDTNATTLTQTLDLSYPLLFKHVTLKLTVLTQEPGVSSVTMKPGVAASTTTLYNFPFRQPTGSSITPFSFIQPIPLLSNSVSLTLTSGGAMGTAGVINVTIATTGWEI